jgi:hypothetical protein
MGAAAMTGGEARGSAPTKPQRFTDGKQRIFLFVQGEGEIGPALDYLSKYADDDDDPEAPLTVQKTNEIRLDDLHANHVVIPVVRNINKDRRKTVDVEGTGGKIAFQEDKAPVFECAPIEVSKFVTRVPTAQGRGMRDNFDRNAFVNAVGKAVVVNGHALCSPRQQRRGDGEGNHVFWLVLTWG